MGESKREAGRQALIYLADLVSTDIVCWLCYFPSLILFCNPFNCSLMPLQFHVLRSVHQTKDTGQKKLI